MYDGPSFSIDNAGWGIAESADSLTLTPADVDGALIISSFTRADGDIDDEELRRLATQGASHEAVRLMTRCGQFHGYTSVYDEKGTHWRVWWLVRGPIHLYATYNCHLDYAGRHDATVDRMLASLRANAAA